MARVLGPNNVPITSATGGAPTRASGEAFGAQVGAAQQQFGRTLEQLGATGQLMDERRKKAEDAVFLDRADLELDMSYGKIAQEEETKAVSGADGMTNTVRSRFESETDPVFDRLKEEGYRPSEEALTKAKSIALHRQHQHLKRAMIYENNERVRNFSVQLDNSLSTIAQNGVGSGDLDSAMTRAEQSIEAHRGILPAAQFEQKRLVAAKHFFDQTMATGDPEAVQTLMEKLSRPTGKPDGKSGGLFPGAETGPEAAAKYGIQPRYNQAANLGLDDTELATVKTRSGAKVTVAAPASAQVQSFLNELEEAGYHIDPKQTGGYNDRNIAGTNRSSQHSFGTAFDINWNENQFDAKGTNNLPPNVGQIADKWGLSWGGYFNGGKKDAMHFEVSRLLDGNAVANVQPPQKVVSGETGVQSDATPAVQENSIRGAFAGMLREKAPQIAKAADAVREQRAAAQRANLILSGQLLVDPGSKDDKEIIDKAFNASGLADHLGQSDPTAATAVTALAKKTGYVPEAAMSQLRALSVNGDVQQKMFAYEAASNLMREKPGIFEGGNNVKELKADASLYETYTTDMGLTAETAVARIGELRSPEFQKRREAIKKDLESNSSVMKQVTGDDLTKEFDGWFSSAPALGGSPGQAGIIVDTYRDLVKENYVKTGDLEVSKAMAKRDLLRTYAVSEATGKKRLMRNPPEKHYPVIEPRDGKDPDHSYFTTQLHDAVKGVAGKDVPIEDIYIETIPQTSADIRAGMYPGYGVVWFEERDGVRVMQSAPGMVFRADVKAEMERQTTNREQRFRDERRKEVERQFELENSGPRKVFKAGKALIQNAIKQAGDNAVANQAEPRKTPEDIGFAF
jgi:hypothetical protein